MNFTIGERVEWTSQANGGKRTKRGFVLCIVPAGTFAATVLQKLLNLPEYNTAALDGGYRTRAHESYIIRAEQSTSSRAKPVPYWPHVTLLRKVKDVR